MAFVLIAVGVVAFAISLVGTQIMRRVAPRCGLVDLPSARKVHRQPMPRGGGLAIFAGIGVTVWLGLLVARSFGPAGAGAARAGSLGRLVQEAVSYVPRMGWMLGGAAVIALVGLIDDKRGLPAWLRLLVQAGVASALVIFDKQIITLFISNPYICGVITVLWMVAITNAFNLLDNMDGLSAGVGMIVSALLMVVALQTGQLFLAALSGVMIGALGGFLVFNFPPARIFMGDCGSTLLGYMLAVTTVDFTFYKPGHPLFPVVVPLLILAVPIFDTLSVVIIRLERGRSPFQADTNHFSHRLVALGMSPRMAVLTIYLVTATVGLGATVVYHATTAAAVLVLLQAAAVFAVIVLLERAARKVARAELGRKESEIPAEQTDSSGNQNVP